MPGIDHLNHLADEYSLAASRSQTAYEQTESIHRDHQNARAALHLEAAMMILKDENVAEVLTVIGYDAQSLSSLNSAMVAHDLAYAVEWGLRQKIEGVLG